MTPQKPFNQRSTSDQPSRPDGDLVDQTQTMGQSVNVDSIPVIEETLHVGKRVIETGQVRLVKTVHQDQQAVQIPLTADEIMVERVLINELVDEPPATRQEGDTIIYPVLKEEYVLVKRLRLVEEIRVTKRQVQTMDNQTVTLRREEVFIERTTVDPSEERSDFSGQSAVAVDSPDESSL